MLLSYFKTAVRLQRQEEIGIRKVIGATVPNIIGLMLNDFAKWLVLATIISVPVAWYAISRWLDNFAYHTDITWIIFLYAGLVVFGIAILTVGWQSIRAAIANPVESLRYE